MVRLSYTLLFLYRIKYGEYKQQILYIILFQFVSNNGENIVEEQVNLKKQIAELTTKLENFQKVNKNLESNLFSLLKTAKAEIARKDKMIDELRKK